MDDQRMHERILISIALFLCAGIICFNFFFVPSLSPPTIVYVDEKLDENEDNDLLEDGVLLNINTATIDEICDTLPGVGKVTAERIVKYRDDSGGFSSIEELMEVKGIGEKSFEKIKQMVCI